MTKGGKIVLITFITLTVFLAVIQFKLFSVKDAISLYLPLTWGLLISLGSSFVFLVRLENHPNIGTDKSTHKVYINLSLATMFLTILHIVLNIIYLFKGQLKKLFGINWYEILSNLYDSFWASSLLASVIFAVIVGAWCLYTAGQSYNE